jgi:hypothetical protein
LSYWLLVGTFPYLYTSFMTTKRQDSPFTNLCNFRFADGRQCTMTSLNPINGYCRSHSTLNPERPPIEADLSSQMEKFYSFTNEDLDVHRALEEVFLSLAANRISYRRAASLAYLGQLLLMSEPIKEVSKLCKRDLQELHNACQTLLDASDSPKPHRPDPPATPPESLEPKTISASKNGHNHHKSH